VDLIYLLQREEIERLRADQARDQDARDAHRDLAVPYSTPIAVCALSLASRAQTASPSI
jgi:hypothetical protein